MTRCIIRHWDGTLSLMKLANEYQPSRKHAVTAALVSVKTLWPALTHNYFHYNVRIFPQNGHRSLGSFREGWNIISPGLINYKSVFDEVTVWYESTTDHAVLPWGNTLVPPQWQPLSRCPHHPPYGPDLHASICVGCWHHQMFVQWHSHPKREITISVAMSCMYMY